jgi:hypothetical protein
MLISRRRRCTGLSSRASWGCRDSFGVRARVVVPRCEAIPSPLFRSTERVPKLLSEALSLLVRPTYVWVSRKR